MNTPYRERRARAAAQLGEGAVAIVPTARVQVRNRDSDFPFRPDSERPSPPGTLGLIAGRFPS